MKRTKETITLGSGKLYIIQYTGEARPEDAEIEKKENLAGYIKGGAAIEYTPEFYDAKDDLGLVMKSIITNEEILLKSGIMTWNGDTLVQLSATGRVEEDTTKGTRTVKIGGAGNDNGKKYLIRFVHTDKVDGDIRVTIIGKNQSGFTLQFSKDEETVIDAEFKAMPYLDADGTLLEFVEDIKEPALKAAGK